MAIRKIEPEAEDFTMLANLIWKQKDISKDDMVCILHPLKTMEQVNKYKKFLETTDISQMKEHQLYMKAKEM